MSIVGKRKFSDGGVDAQRDSQRFYITNGNCEMPIFVSGESDKY